MHYDGYYGPPVLPMMATMGSISHYDRPYGH